MARYGLFALVLSLGVAAAGRDALDRWVAQTVLPPLLVQTSVEVRDRHGALLRLYGVENGRQRMALRLDEVDPGFVEMLVAYEDRRFYEHGGVDPRALIRAAGQALWQGRVVSGGSTLTMQVARLTENSGTGRWEGKLRQMRVALALERRLSKARILELYLAHAPYGGGVEGLAAGTRVWFGKPPARLTPAQAALLVALPQAPEARRPDRHPVAARRARDRVLERVGPPALRQEVTALPPVPRQMRPFPRLAPHLADRARAADPLTPRHRLTIDATLQARIEALAARAVAGQAAQVSAAIMVADHRNGEILAVAGSAAYAAAGGRQGFVDMSRALRSPGSTLKPLIYGLAFDRGLAHPETIINDAPVRFGRYAPQNFDGVFRGEVSLREALQLSLNIPPVRLTEALGPARLMAALRAGGARPELPGTPGLAVALGGVGLRLEDLVQLYAGLAAGGTAPALVWRQGAEPPAPRRLMSPAAAWQVGHILAGIAPPAGAAAQAGQIAYKTGTSYGHRDAWAVGYDGAHVIGVWLGRPDGTPVPGAFGGDLAAPVLFEAFARIKHRPAPLGPPPPETLLVRHGELPARLQRFRGPQDPPIPGPGAAPPQISFPPHGAVLRLAGGGVPLKLRAGRLPLTVLVDGTPVLTGLRVRETMLDLPGPGFAQLSVIDAAGRSAAVKIALD